MPFYPKRTVQLEQSVDVVDVRQQHAPATVPLEPELRQDLPRLLPFLQHALVRLMLVGNHLPACVAPDGDDHRVV